MENALAAAFRQQTAAGVAADLDADEEAEEMQEDDEGEFSDSYDLEDEGMEAEGRSLLTDRRSRSLSQGGEEYAELEVDEDDDYYDSEDDDLDEDEDGAEAEQLEGDVGGEAGGLYELLRVHSQGLGDESDTEMADDSSEGTYGEEGMSQLDGDDFLLAPDDDDEDDGSDPDDSGEFDSYDEEAANDFDDDDEDHPFGGQLGGAGVFDEHPHHHHPRAENSYGSSYDDSSSSSRSERRSRSAASQDGNREGPHHGLINEGLGAIDLGRRPWLADSAQELPLHYNLSSRQYPFAP